MAGSAGTGVAATRLSAGGRWIRTLGPPVEDGAWACFGGATGSSGGPICGSHLTHRWREMDSNPRSPVAGKGQAAGSSDPQEENWCRDRSGRVRLSFDLVKRAPDQPSRILCPPTSLFGRRSARWGAWHASDDERSSLENDAPRPGKGPSTAPGRHPCSANSAAIRTRRPQKAKRSRRSGRLWAKATPAEIATTPPTANGIPKRQSTCPAPV